MEHTVWDICNISFSNLLLTVVMVISEVELFLSFRYMFGHTPERNVMPHRTTVLHPDQWSAEGTDELLWCF